MKPKYWYLPIEYRMMANWLNTAAYLRGDINLRELRALEYGVYPHTSFERAMIKVWDWTMAIVGGDRLVSTGTDQQALRTGVDDPKQEKVDTHQQQDRGPGRDEGEGDQ